MVPDAQVAASTPTPVENWVVQNPSPDSNPIFAMSCPTTTTCFGAGFDGLLRTINGGSTWVEQTTTNVMNAISCASASTCVAVDGSGAGMWTSNGGNLWTSTTIKGGTSLWAVSCPSTMVCFVTGSGGSILRTGDGGATWSAQASVTANSLYSISCPSTTVCVAVGAGGTTVRTTDGSSWTAGSLGPAALYGISCPTTTTCAAVGPSGNSPVSKDGGATWSYGVSGSTSTLAAVSCPSDAQCFAAGVDGSVYIESLWCSGTISVAGCWSRSSTGETGALYAISCESTSLCFAAGDYGIIVTTGNGGTGWHKQSPNAFPQMNAVSCPSASVCFAVGSPPNVLATSDGGTSWSMQPSSVAPFISLSGISCPATTTCFAVGNVGTIVATTDGGAHWNLQTSGTGLQLTAISCATTSACFAVGGGGTILATTDGGAHWGGQTSGTSGDLAAISCPTSSVCYAGGSPTTALGTTNAGANWNALGGFPGGMTGISCMSSTSCFAVGTLIRATTDSGATWPATTAPPGSYLAISCASTTVCTATAGSSAVSTPDGSTWASQATPATGDYLYGVSCPSTTTCFAGGAAPQGGVIVGTTDGGATPWRWLAPSGTPGDLKGVSCPSATECFAVGGGGAGLGGSGGGDILRTTNGGVGWFLVFHANYSVFNAISCPSTSVCFAVASGQSPDGSVFTTTDGGAHWATQLVPPGSGYNPGYISLSCPTTTNCFAVSASGGEVQTADGTNWTTPAQLGFATTMSGISCPTSSTCFAADGSTPGRIFASTNGGASWAMSFDIAADTQAGNNGPFRGIDCPSTNTCFATGTNGLIAATTDGGANWRTDNVPSSALLTAVSCPSPSTCYVSANDSSILYTTNFGGTWEVQFPAEAAFYAGVSCPSAATCFAVGGSGAISATTTGGAAWTRLRPTGSTDGIFGLSCYGSSNCYAVGAGTLLATHNGGGSWVAHTLGTTDALDGISCPGTSTCFAVGWPGAIYVTTNGGTSWTYQTSTLSGSDQTITAVSCASLTHCVAVGTNGVILSTINGTTWSSESSGTSANLFGISCPNTSSCIAVGTGGTTLTRTGGSWHAYSSGTTQGLAGVDCLTTNTCYAVGLAGTILVTTNRGATWSIQSSGTTANLYGIACAQPTFCVADGQSGAALVTVDGGTWKPLNLPVFNTLHAAAFPDLNHVWLAGNGGTILADSTLFPSCRSVSITPSTTSPQPVGTTVTLTAAASGCPDAGPQYKFWLRSPAGVWNVVQDYTTATTFSWNTATYAPGTYLIGVWVIDANSSFSYDAYAFGTFTVQQPVCASTNLAPDVGSPQAVGTTINFTAAALGCPSPRFQWWVRDVAGNWQIAVPFATGNTFAWNTTGLTDGTYQIGVWARQAYSTASYEAFAFDTYTLTVSHCTSVSLGLDKTSPQTIGAGITMTPVATGCPSPEYRFYVRDNAGTWHIVQDFGLGTTYNWTTAPPVSTNNPGTYLLGVWARQPGSANSYDAFAFVTFSLISGTTCTVNIAGDKLSPQAVGSGAVTWTATATALNCPSGPLKYQFWVNPPGGTWGIVQPFSTTSTFAWTGASAGTYQIGVWVKQAGSVAAYDNFAFTTFTLTPATPSQACTWVNVGASPASPQLVGTSVTLSVTGVGNCPNPEYRWWVRDLAANWVIKQDYTVGATTYSWNTSTYGPGTYLVGVWARQLGSVASYEAYSFITYTLTVPAPQVCTSVNISPDLTSPRAPGTTITFTAVANGCSNPTYQFYIAPPGGTFSALGNFSSTTSLVWDTSGLSPGPWQIGVWARQSGSSASYESFAFITFQLTAG